MESQSITNENKFLFDVYSGGRHLNAIDSSTTLNMPQKHLMLVLGSQLDFRDFQKSKRYISVKCLSEKMSCSPRLIHKLTSELKAMGYIEIEHRFEDNKQKSNNYSLTDKVFIEHYDKICPAQYSGGGVNIVQTELPKKELPQEEKLISKDISKKNQKNGKNGDVRKVVGYLGAMFKPDGSPETRGFPWVNKEQLEAVAETLMDEFTLVDIKGWYRQYVKRGLLGKMRWAPSEISASIRSLLSQKTSGTVDKTTSATSQNDDEIDWSNGFFKL